MRAFAGVVRANEMGAERVEDERPPVALVNGILTELWAAFAALGLWALPSVRRYFSRMSAVRLACLFGIMLLAVGLRSFLSPYEFLHVNRHGFRLVGLAVRPDAIYEHGNAYVMFFHWIFALLPGNETTVFRIDALLGALSVLLVFFLTRDLFGDENAGLWAALFYAALPLQLRFSASEDPLVLGSFLALAGTAAFLRYARTGGGLWLAMGVVSAALLAQECRSFIVFPLMIFVMLLLVGRGPVAALKDWKLWVGCAIFLAACALHLRYVWQTGSEYRYQFYYTAGEIWRHAVETAVFLHLSVTPGIFPLLFLMGLWAAGGKRREIVFLLLCIVGWGYVFLYNTGLDHVLRTQMSYTFLYMPLCGAGAESLLLSCRRLKHKKYGAAFGMLPAVVVILAAIMPGGYRPMIRAPMNQWAEEHFLRESAESLRGEGRLNIVTFGKLDVTGEIDATFPAYLFRSDGREARVYGIGNLMMGEPDPARGDVLYYEGLPCYSFALKVARGGMQPECARVREAFTLKPVRTTTFDARDEDYVKTRGGRLTIGFYRLVRKR